MTSILKRTVFIEENGGALTFQDWALCTTTLGTMVEPFMPNTRKSNDVGMIDFDPTDEISRIDQIQRINSDLLPKLLSGGDDVLHGGTHMPRVGR